MAASNWASESSVAGKVVSGGVTVEVAQKTYPIRRPRRTPQGPDHNMGLRAVT
ncbi:hypothetical protein AB0M43_38700 [Longispora sp. NPDC051575]|uniref:hypothetical protein n=1 Tax=Longispora sp. NPDC051575 TaxID=3154943 RepID=UPI003418A94A